MKKVFCKKLKKDLEGFEKSPFPGPIGEKIVKEISKDAWQLWLDRQIMLINEYRLNTFDPKAQEFLNEQMELFLFSDDQEPPPPPGYKDQ